MHRENSLTHTVEKVKLEDGFVEQDLAVRNGRTRFGVKTKRILVVVNPYATTVSDRLKSLVLYALRSRYEVDSVETERPDHAEELAIEAANEGFDLVVAFGGDGTVNEIANGLLGSDVPLSVLPGGSTNVFCRALGIPNDIVEATEHLLRLDVDRSIKKVDLGCVNGRYFVFGSGIGIDADAVQHVDSHPNIKARFGEVFYGYQLLVTYNMRFRGKPPKFEVEVEGEEPRESVSVVIQNATPFTYFGDHKLEVCEDVTLDSGTLSYAGLRRAYARDLPSLAKRFLSSKSTIGHKHAIHSENIRNITVRSIAHDSEGDPISFPLHVDGDYMGRFTEANYSIHPRALTVLS